MGRKKTEEQDHFESLISKLNYRKRIKLRLRKLSGGGYSLLLALSIDRKWQYENLKDLKLSGKREHRNSDNNLIEIASAIRDQRELEIIQNGEVQLYSWKSKQNFLEYFDGITLTKTHPCNWNNTRNMLREFTKDSLSFGEIDRAFCRRFVDFLLRKVAPGTASVYYGTFKAALNQAVLEDILQKNPGNSIKIPRVQQETNYLTLDELRILKDTPIEYPDVKNAFLFSCFTGLRFSDVESLEWADINEGSVIKRQKKTGTFVKLPLVDTALDILEQQRELAEKLPRTKIFDLPVNHNTNVILKLWIKMAGINKKITFHCSRHTFATLSLNSGIDIYTVSKLLGHADVANTQRYAKLMDSKRDQEMQKLPKL